MPVIADDYPPLQHADEARTAFCFAMLIIAVLMTCTEVAYVLPIWWIVWGFIALVATIAFLVWFAEFYAMLRDYWRAEHLERVNANLHQDNDDLRVLLAELCAENEVLQARTTYR